MVDTSLEVVCKACGRSFWYRGERSYPETVECPNCNHQARIPEDG